MSDPAHRVGEGAFAESFLKMGIVPGDGGAWCRRG